MCVLGGAVLEVRRAATEHLRGRPELDVDLDADDGLVAQSDGLRRRRSWPVSIGEAARQRSRARTSWCPWPSRSASSRRSSSVTRHDRLVGRPVPALRRSAPGNRCRRCERVESMPDVGREVGLACAAGGRCPIGLVAREVGRRIRVVEDAEHLGVVGGRAVDRRRQRPRRCAGARLKQSPTFSENTLPWQPAVTAAPKRHGASPAETRRSAPRAMRRRVPARSVSQGRTREPLDARPAPLRGARSWSPAWPARGPRRTARTRCPGSPRPCARTAAAR